MNLKKSASDAGPVNEVGTDNGSRRTMIMAGGAVVAAAVVGVMAFVLLSSGGDDDSQPPIPSAASAAVPSAPGTVDSPTTSASIPTYAAANAKDPFKALVTDVKAGGGSGGGQATTAPVAPGSGSTGRGSTGGSGGAIILPGKVITVTRTVTPTTAPTSVPSTTGSTPPATGTSTPSTSTTTIALPKGTQLVYLGDIVKDGEGKPQSVTVFVDNGPHKGLTPQRDVEPAKQETFGTYYMLLGLTDTCATIQYGDGSVFDVCQGQYHYVTS